MMPLAVTIGTTWVVLGAIALAFVVLWLIAGMFAPFPRYQIVGANELPPNDSPRFLDLVESLVDAKANSTGIVEVLTGGQAFYPAILDAMRAARRSIHLEAYVFHKGNIASQYVEVLTERARNGVQVNLVLDAFGSMNAPRSYFRPLLEAGGKVSRYNGLRWYTLTHLDNRTHRELCVIDGQIGFIGGAGIADQWWTGVKDSPRWRDTMVRIEGPAVASLQATFAENWLASSGELLVGEASFPAIECQQPATMLVINSTPTVGGSTRARILMQLLLASARHSISITTPYFLPDKSLMHELCSAVERGVRVRILVPGLKSDHLLTRSTSRGGYGPLLKAGAEVYEYQPSMIHAKILCVDDLWSVVGSTNFDNRSFGINDEVNLALRDAAVTQRLQADLVADLRQSRAISLDEWNHRPATERASELFGWIIERQQ